MRYLVYRSLMMALLPLAVLRLLWRSRREVGYRQAIPERLGLSLSGQTADIWVHAVSAGESIAIAPMVERLLEADYKIVVTTTTPSGRAQLAQQFEGRVDICYAPYDLGFAIRGFLKHKQPKLGLFVETEIWPIWIQECIHQSMPMALVNGRLSDKSFRGYQKLGPLMTAALRGLTQVLVQSDAHADRFAKLGAEPAKVCVTGSIKMDQTLPFDFSSKVDQIQLRLPRRRILLGASTHPGEETCLLAMFASLRQQYPDLLLALVPRHVQRAAAIEKEGRNRGFATQRISAAAAWDDQEVLIVDQMGQLLSWYGASEVAFVGGSLVPHGGHNFMEAALAGCAIVTGPHLFNFEAQAAAFKEAGALQVAADDSELQLCVTNLLGDERQRLDLVTRASNLLQLNRGAVNKSLACLAPWLPKERSA